MIKGVEESSIDTWLVLSKCVKGVLLIVSGTIDTFHTCNNGVDIASYSRSRISTAVWRLS